MALTVEPNGSVDWATTTVLNSPTGTANKEDYDARYGNIGWLYGEFPPYQVFNEWQFRVGQWISWNETNLKNIDLRVEDLELAGGGGGGATVTEQINEVKDLCFSNANQILKLLTEKYSGSDSVIETFADATDIAGASDGTHDAVNHRYKTVGAQQLVSTTYDFLVPSKYALIIQSQALPTVAATIGGVVDNLVLESYGEVAAIKELDDSGVTTSGLIHQWLMRDATPTLIPDSAGSADMSIAGTLADDPGPNGALPAKDFQVANNAVAESTWFPTATGFTLLGWAKTNDGQQYMLSTHVGELKDGFHFSCDGSFVGLSVNSSGNSGVSSFSLDISATPISNAEWHLYGFYINGTSVDLILDGAVVASGTLSDGWTWSGSTDFPFRLGTRDYDGSVADLNASYGDIRVYNRQLTAQELLDIYNVFQDVSIKAYVGESTLEGSTISLDVEDAEVIDKYTIFSVN